MASNRARSPKAQEVQRILLEHINAVPANQPRPELRRGSVETLKGLIDSREKLPPVLVAHNGDRYDLFDGFHRFTASIEAGAEYIDAIVVPDQHLAWEKAADLNAQGTQWTSKDAMRHAAQGIRDGCCRNPDGSPWPVSVLAMRYQQHGVKRNTLTRFLDNLGESDPAIAAYMADSRASYDKGHRPEKPAKTPAELADAQANKRRSAAHRHMEQAAKMLRSEPVQAHGQLTLEFRKLLRAARVDYERDCWD